MRQEERLRQVAIDIHKTAYIIVEQVNPADKTVSEVHKLEGLTYKRPFYTIKNLFLVEGENSNQNVGQSGIVDNITKKGYILPNEVTRNTTSLVLLHNKMDNFEESTS